MIKTKNNSKLRKYLESFKKPVMVPLDDKFIILDNETFHDLFEDFIYKMCEDGELEIVGEENGEPLVQIKSDHSI